MTMYLDYENLSNLLRDGYGDPSMMSRRLVGVNREYQSAYFDIVRFFGPDQVNPKAVTITHHPQTFRFSDTLVEQFSRQIEAELRRSGRLYAGPLAMKLISADFRSAGSSLWVQPAEYADQAGSCFALDYRSPIWAAHGGTLRSYLNAIDPDHSVTRNPLAICLGVAADLIVREDGTDWRLQVTRSGKLASMENSLGPSVAGSVDWESESTALDQLIKRALESEAREELGLEPVDYELIPLAYAREILRGERPQLFAILRSKLGREEILARISGIPAEKREFSACEFFPVSDGWLQSVAGRALNFEASMTAHLIEEFRSISPR
jgi:hypothetical protein